MTFLFRDKYSSDIWYKITAESEKEAAIKAISTMLNKESILLSDLYNDIDIELTNIDSLTEYE